MEIASVSGARSALGRTRVPAGFDMRFDPPGTDYSDPANPVEHDRDVHV